MRPSFLLALFLASTAISSTAIAQEPLVRLDEVERREGPADAIELTRELRASMRAFQRCQELRIAAGAALEGRLDLLVVVAPTGEITSVEVERRTFAADPTLEACLLERVRRARVPARESPSAFAFALTLSLPVAPPPPEAPAAATDEAAAVRAEIEAARTEGRCLARAARRLERALEAWEAAGPRRRERLAASLAEARGAAAMCRGILAALLASPGVLETGGIALDGECTGCRGAESEPAPAR